MGDSGRKIMESLLKRYQELLKQQEDLNLDRITHQMVEKELAKITTSGELALAISKKQQVCIITLIAIMIVVHD